MQSGCRTYTAQLNFCSSGMLKALKALASGPIALVLKVQALALRVEVLALPTSLTVPGD